MSVRIGRISGIRYVANSGERVTAFSLPSTWQHTLARVRSAATSFDFSDGAVPYARLLQGTDGNFYATTGAGGANNNCTDGCGTVFKMTPGGTVSTLHSFDASDGSNPYGGLVQSTNGKFYGTTGYGGASNCSGGCGTVFSLSVGLGPFVETLPTSGKVGAPVTILGNNLTSATRVTFNGTKAKFKASSSKINTTVPTGATTGFVKVTTPKRTLKSSVVFRVTK